MVSGRYRLDESVGRGATGQVFRATDLLLDDTVALKLFFDAHESFEVARREVRLARKVTHPNVARVYDLGLEGRHVFVTMELVSGEPLSAAIHRTAAVGTNRWPLGVVLHTVLDVARGLVEVHSAGVVHRDIKPANVLVTSTRAVLTDFGIALAFADGAVHDESGTPAYMAPEQILGNAVDARTDVYSLGLVLYQLLTGVRAHEADGRIVPVKRLTEPAPNARSVAPHVPAHLSGLVERMLSVEPERRPNAVAVLQALEAIQGGGVTSAVTVATPSTSHRPLTSEDEELVRHATRLLDRYVIDATREAVATLEGRVDGASYEVSALLARALLRLWAQVGGQDDTLLLRAEEMALRTLALDPSNTTVQLALATVQRELGAYRASLRVAKNLVEAHPTLAEAHAIAGRASFELGALDDALAHLTEATRLAPNGAESWLDLTRFRAMAGVDAGTIWQELDVLSERFGAATTASLRMRFAFVFRDRARAAEVAKEIASARTGAVWEVSLPELEAFAGMRPKTPSIVSEIVERTRNRRPPAHRERVYHEVMIERLVALDELDSAHDWLEHDGVILGPVWLERCPSLEPLRGQSRFHGAHAMHHVSHQKKSAGQRR